MKNAAKGKGKSGIPTPTAASAGVRESRFAKADMPQPAAGNATTTETILVGLRLRPPIEREKGQKQVVLIEDGVVVLEPVGKGAVAQRFQIDYPMDSVDPTSSTFTSQERVFDIFGMRMCDHALQGYNSALFAYGQTGTGKTTTIMGDSTDLENRGVLPRMINEMFSRADQIITGGGEVVCDVQMLEVYNESVRDLLAPELPKGPKAKNAPPRPKPEVHVHPKLGVYVKEATDATVESYGDCMSLIEYGNTMKTIAATAMNHQSSRAHTIVRLKVTTRIKGDNAVGNCKMSDIYVVDLAGRENERTTLVTGDRLAELSFINRSLMWLSKCIQDLGHTYGARSSANLHPPANPVTPKDSPRLSPREIVANLPAAMLNTGSSSASTKRASGVPGAKSSAAAKPGAKGLAAKAKPQPRKSAFGGSQAPESSKSNFIVESSTLVKFRNSKLTLLLSNALSGNSRTAMIATASPAASSHEETLSTLNFAATVKNIKLQATAASTVNKDDLVKSLQEEVQALKAELTKQSSSENAGVKGEDGSEGVQAQPAFVKELQERLEAAEALAQRHAMSFHEMRNMSRAAKEKREHAMKQVGTTSKAELPFLANISDDPHLDGRLTFHIPDGRKDFSIGSSEECDVSIGGLGIDPVTCLLHNEGPNGLFIQAGRAEDGKIAKVRVNGVDVDTQRVELHHGDKLELGHAYALVVRTERDLSTLRRRSRARSSFDGRDRTLSSWLDLAPVHYLNTVIGRERALDSAQLLIAQEYYAHCQARARKNFGGSSHLRAFVLNAQRVRRHVDEANAITEKLKPNSGYYFELSSESPVLAFGHGHQEIPELSVRVMCKIPRAQVLWGIARRAFANRARQILNVVCQLERMGLGGTMSSDARVLFIWTYRKFEARLQLMRAAYNEWYADPGSYTNPLFDPWSEESPGELQELQDGRQHQQQHRLREAQDESEKCSAEARKYRAENEELRAEVRRLREELASAPVVAADASSPKSDPAAGLQVVVTAGSQALSLAHNSEDTDRQRFHEPHDRQEVDIVDLTHAQQQEQQLKSDRDKQEWQRILAKVQEMTGQIASLKQNCTTEVQTKHRAIDFAMEQLKKISAAHETLQRSLCSQQSRDGGSVKDAAELTGSTYYASRALASAAGQDICLAPDGYLSVPRSQVVAAPIPGMASPCGGGHVMYQAPHQPNGSPKVTDRSMPSPRTGGQLLYPVPHPSTGSPSMTERSIASPRVGGQLLYPPVPSTVQGSPKVAERSMSVPASANRCGALRPVSAASAASPTRVSLGPAACAFSPQVPSAATIAVSPLTTNPVSARPLVADAPHHPQCHSTIASSSAYCPYCQSMGRAPANSPASINSPINSPMVPAPPLSPRQLAGEPAAAQYCHAHRPAMPVGTYSQVSAATPSPVKSITLPARPGWAPLQVPRPSSLQSTPRTSLPSQNRQRTASSLPGSVIVPSEWEAVAQRDRTWNSMLDDMAICG